MKLIAATNIVKYKMLDTSQLYKQQFNVKVFH